MQERSGRYPLENSTRHQSARHETQAEHSRVPPKPPRRTGIGTAEMNSKPSKEQIVNAMKDMNRADLAYILAELKKMLARRR